MQLASEEIFKKNINDVEDAISTRSPILYETSNVTLDFFDSIDIALSKILQLKHYQHLRSPLSFVVKELIGNAQKSNMKRVFFRMNDLSITDEKDYKKGMEQFTEIVRESPEFIENKLADYRMFVKVSFNEYVDKRFCLTVENSAQITTEERERIVQKLRLYTANKNNFNIFDITEGAGMGIFLSLKMLEKVGIKPSSIHIKVGKGTTIAELNFNFDEVSPPPYDVIAKEILKEITELPQYPENIKIILNKLHDPEVSIDRIVDELRKDPTLTAEILKLVNSAQFMMQRKIASIKEALNLIGLKGLKNILFSYGAMKTVSDRFGTVPEIWDHCYNVASISSLIAKKILRVKNDDEFFTAGLLHDIGKIVLMGVNEATARRIEHVCSEREIDMPIMEEIMMGLSHAQIGGKIAQLWGFPESLVSAIFYHHEPILAKTHHEIVNTVFLANYLDNLKSEEELSIYAIEPEVRILFNLMSNIQLISFAKRLEIFNYK